MPHIANYFDLIEQLLQLRQMIHRHLTWLLIIESQGRSIMYG